jgi:tRNA nucleotidyltransferase (CCA-adding enzyme)
LMQQMVNAGEVDHLVPERVWQEMATGLMEHQPVRMMEVLQACGALEKILPGLRVTPGEDSQLVRALASAAGQHLSLPVRWAVLSADIPMRSALLSRVPAICSGLSELLEREYGALQRADSLSAKGLVQLLERCDAFRKPGRFGELLQACACLNPSVNTSLLSQALRLASEIATDTVAAHAISAGASGPLIGQAILEARVAALTTGGCGRPA